MDSCHSGFIRLRYHLNNACPSYISPPWPTRYRKMVTGFIAGFLCIFIAGWIAPNHQKATMLILVVIYGFYWMSEAQKVAMVSAIVSGQRVD